MSRKAALFFGMGIECIVAVMVFIYIGRYLDTEYGWKGLGTALGAFVGLTGWLVHLLAVVRQLAKEEQSGHTDRK